MLLATEGGIAPSLLPWVLLGLLPEPREALAIHWYPLADVRGDGLAPTLYVSDCDAWAYEETLRRLALFRVRPCCLAVTQEVPTDAVEASVPVLRMPVQAAYDRGRRRAAAGLQLEVRDRQPWAAATPLELRGPARLLARGTGDSVGTGGRSGVVLRAHVNGNGSIAHLARLLAIALTRTLDGSAALWLEDLVGKPASANATMSARQRKDLSHLARAVPTAGDRVVASVRAPYRLAEEALTRSEAFDWPEHADAPQYMWGGIAYSQADAASPPMQAMMDCFDRWLAVSTHSQRALVAGGMSPQRVRVLPHPVDDRLFRPGGRGRPAASPFTVLNVSVGFAQLKGVDVLLRAAARAFAGDRRAVLRIHQRKGGLEELLADNPLAADAFARLGDQVVVTTGPLTQDELARRYTGSDLYVQPSRAEASGLTALEAACCGTPAVATGWGGPTDYIDGRAVQEIAYELREATPRRDQPLARGGCGLWAEPSVEHLAELLHEARTHRDERAAAAREAAPGLHARFGLDAVGQRAQALLFHAEAWAP